SASPTLPSSSLLFCEELRVLAVPLALQLVAVDESQGGRVHAVYQPALVARPVREAVAKVTVAVLGADLGPCHAARDVNVLDDVCGLEGPRETRKSRPAVELVERCEERLAGNHVDRRRQAPCCPSIRWRRGARFRESA